MIELTLTVEEVNQLLSALGQRSYQEVFQLINKIQQQAQTQLQNDMPLSELESGNDQPKGEQA